jgi:hypothetical protein
MYAPIEIKFIASLGTTGCVKLMLDWNPVLPLPPKCHDGDSTGVCLPATCTCSSCHSDAARQNTVYIVFISNHHALDIGRG